MSQGDSEGKLEIDILGRPQNDENRLTTVDRQLETNL